MRLRRLALTGLLLAGCKAHKPTDEQRVGMRSVAHDDTREPAKEAPFSPKSLQRCFADDASGAPPRQLGALLDRASDRHEHGEYNAALACAEEATRVEPRSVEGHEDRALALAELGRKDEARAAIGRALAIDPDDPHTLVSAADLFLNRIGNKQDVEADDAYTALEHALRGLDRLRHARGKVDRPLRARLDLLAGQALSDLGRAKEALPHLDAAAAGAPDDISVRYERGVALFDLCRFKDAEKSLREVLAKEPKDAFAHQELGLVLEQRGDPRGAAHELAEAQRLSPSEIRAPIDVPRAEFDTMVREEIAALPVPLRTDLARVELELPDLPAIADLTADDPPLPPTILGLFRGGPLAEATGLPSQPQPERHAHGDASVPDDEHRAIALYRLNLIRAVQDKKELREQVRTTLYHELGHLRGEDDDALRARGLE